MNLSKNRYLRNQRGLSLVELLIAAAVGLVLLGGVYRLFVSSSDTYSMDEQLARVQESGRFALEFLTQDLRMAGYRGCAGDVPTVNTLNDTTFDYGFGTPLEGFEAVSAVDWNPDRPAAVNAGATGGSDILTMRNILPFANPVYISEAMPNSSADMKVSENSGIADNDILLITDCTGSAVFQVDNLTPLGGGKDNVVHNEGGTPAIGSEDYPGNLTKDLGHSFSEGAELTKITTVSYYVMDSNGQPTLFRKTGTEAEQPLVEGIENLQVLFGRDTDNDDAVNDYVTAETVADWSQVVAVRLFLLVRSPNEVLHGDLNVLPANYGVFGLADPDDRRMRLVYSTTIGLRNRLP